MTFTTDRQNGVACGDWDGIHKAAAKYHRAKIEITDFDAQEISEQQRKWLHCKAGPIRELMREGWSFRDAKEYLKVEYGRGIFVVELTDDNFSKIDGVFRWECRRATCRKLIHPMDILIDEDSIRCCPYCSNQEGALLIPIALKSIMDISVKKINLWFDEIFAHMPKIQPPDPDWKKNEKELRK